MPTLEQVRKWADDFERAYPAELPDRFRWFHTELEISQSRLLRLMGMAREQVAALADGGVDWKWAIAEVGEESAWWAESVIGEVLALYHFNWEELRQVLRWSCDRGFPVDRPGGKQVPLNTLSPEEQENYLLTLVSENGPRTTSALIAFLSQPATASVNR